jgi:D-tagatose-1,6-bisphosphate aldolase subunit GatZ/KbaZ
MSFLSDLAASRRVAGQSGVTSAGITSVCSAHPIVIEAALRQAKSDGTPALIEATCNQVNHRGGYTGMTPVDFRRMVEEIAARSGFDPKHLILGGDHLGPNPWKNLPADQAMAEASAMVEAYVRAGYGKIHLDASMGCLGEGAVPPDDVIAARAASLAEIAERARPGASVYVIGTEVPVPGGTTAEHHGLQVTKPADVLNTIEIHRRAFDSHGVGAAFDRVIAVVVQPGVEFGNDSIDVYDPPAARDLSAVLDQATQFVFEAHSTDYQPQRALSALVRDGFAILKVGPHLTFALREALYGLDMIAAELDGAGPLLRESMEAVMLKDDKYWRPYYQGGADELRRQRHFSYSDRIRYYWTTPEARAAVDRLLQRLDNRPLPATLIGQYLGGLAEAVTDGAIEPRPGALLLAAVRSVLANYAVACRAKGSS